MLSFSKRLALAWRILRSKPSNLTTFAAEELRRKYSGDEMDRLMADNIMEIVTVFCTQGHSGFSSGFAVSGAERLMRFLPLGPLNGLDIAPGEWMEVGEYDEYTTAYQSRRCPHVFAYVEKPNRSNPNGGTMYRDLDGYVFEYPDGIRFTSGKSAKPIAMPYTPGNPPIVVKVDDAGVPLLTIYKHLATDSAPLEGEHLMPEPLSILLQANVETFEAYEESHRDRAIGAHADDRLRKAERNRIMAERNRAGLAQVNG